MDEKHSVVWIPVIRSLEDAALLPQQRDEQISRALQHLLASTPIAGTALIWPCAGKKNPWKVYYAGINRVAMHRWLSAHLEASLEVAVGAIEHDLTRTFSEMPSPLLMHLQTKPTSPGGVWIIWLAPSSATASFSTSVFPWLEPIRQTLEAVLEVEEREAYYFLNSSPIYDQDLLKALVHGDASAMAAFLSLTRVIAGADLTFWGRAYQDVLEVENHLGARQNGFGFVLPRGHGVGGRVITSGKPIAVPDYRNSSYRDPSVSDTVDSEQIRAGLAIPIHAKSPLLPQTTVAAVLYATRRGGGPFSRAECLLAERLTREIGPLPIQSRSPVYFMPGVSHLPEHRMGWYDLVLHARRIEAVEAWASQIIKGAAIVTDAEGKPYILSNDEQLERLQTNAEESPPIILPLTAPGLPHSGHVYLCPGIGLPPAQWPDFFADLIVACNAVITRMERAQDQLDRQREQWLRSLINEKKLPLHLEQDGYRLGLTMQHGQIWVLVWPPGSIQASKFVRRRIMIENVVLDCLKSPLIFFEDDMAAILLEGRVTEHPSKVRDALLKVSSPHPLWIVHGGRYQELDGLKLTLTHTVALAQKARREAYEKYLLDISTVGLDSLLENPKLAEDLGSFAGKLLTPLIEYDAANGSYLTETFVLVQTLGSVQAVADQLGMHVNTIRYRLHRAESVLGIDQHSPKEQVALTLAAFAWQRFHKVEL
jgi:sugar diacid utilization regulator